MDRLAEEIEDAAQSLHDFCRRTNCGVCNHKSDHEAGRIGCYSKYIADRLRKIHPEKFVRFDYGNASAPRIKWKTPEE